MGNERFKAITEKFTSCSILVIGDFMIDEYIYGTVDRISPEAPVPVVLAKDVRRVLGGAGNVVLNLLALKAKVFPVGVVGADKNGERLKQNILERGVASSSSFFLSLEDRPTTRKTRIIAGNQQVCRLDRERRILLTEEEESKILKGIEPYFDRCQAVIISDYDKGVVTPTLIKKIVALANKKKKFVAVDPQVSHFEHYKSVHVLTPNHHEAGRFIGRELKEDVDIIWGGFEILQRLNARSLLITRGEKGMTLFSDDKAAHFPTEAREVFDVTGAGDTVISVYTLAIAAGATQEEAVMLSNRAAGIVVAKSGAATATVEEILKDMEARPPV